MKTLDFFFRLFPRFRYPVALPEDIDKALGIGLRNSLTFDECIHRLINPSCSPSRLTKMMPRLEAEEVFTKAQRQERFGQSTLFSYYFMEGWLEFDLLFIENRLRRLYIRHRSIKNDQGRIEIRLSK